VGETRWFLEIGKLGPTTRGVSRTGGQSVSGALWGVGEGRFFGCRSEVAQYNCEKGDNVLDRGGGGTWTGGQLKAVRKKQPTSRVAMLELGKTDSKSQKNPPKQFVHPEDKKNGGRCIMILPAGGKGGKTYLR